MTENSGCCDRVGRLLRQDGAAVLTVNSGCCDRVGRLLHLSPYRQMV